MDLPDWISPFVVRGWDGSEFQNAKVNSDGNFEMFIKALFGSTSKNVQCDTNGNLTLNLKAQDLSELINRNKYGGAQKTSGTTMLSGTGLTTLLEVSATGVIYGGYIRSLGGDAPPIQSPRFYADNTQIADINLDTYQDFGYFTGVNYPLRMICDDRSTPRYIWDLQFGITFESSFKLAYYVNSVSAVTVTYNIIYAVV